MSVSEISSQTETILCTDHEVSERTPNVATAQLELESGPVSRA